MKDCPSCGTSAPPEADFCAKCGQFLHWVGEPSSAGSGETQPPQVIVSGGGSPIPSAVGAGEEAGIDVGVPVEDAVDPEVPVRPETGSALEPPVPLVATTRRHPPIVALEPARLEIQTGRSTSATMGVTNPNDESAGFVIGVAGPMSRWTRVDPRRITVPPHSEQTVVVTFEVPRDATVAAGESEVRIGAESVDDAAVIGWASMRIQVAAFEELFAQLHPQILVSHRTARSALRVTNAGNRPVDISITAGAEGSPLRMSVEPQSFHLEPGASVQAVVRFAGPSIRLTGSDRWPISVRVADPAAAATVDGVFEYRGMFAGPLAPMSYAAFGAGIGIGIATIVSGFLR